MTTEHHFVVNMLRDIWIQAGCLVLRTLPGILKAIQATRKLSGFS